jgi:activator of HSP90 ATPase
MFCFDIKETKRKGLNMDCKIYGTTRRQMIAGVAMFAVGTAMQPEQAGAEIEEISHSAESIHQETVFKASRKRVYDALTSTDQFDKMFRLGSGMNTSSLGKKPTVINREPGGSFTLFGGHIVGRQIELVPNERIVQGWRVVDWAPGVYSIAKFELLEHASGTKLVFDHTGFPDGLGRHLADGWKSHYWEPLEKFLTGESK